MLERRTEIARANSTVVMRLATPPSSPRRLRTDAAAEVDAAVVRDAKEPGRERARIVEAPGAGGLEERSCTRPRRPRPISHPAPVAMQSRAQVRYGSRKAR